MLSRNFSQMQIHCFSMLCNIVEINRLRLIKVFYFSFAEITWNHVNWFDYRLQLMHAYANFVKCYIIRVQLHSVERLRNFVKSTLVCMLFKQCNAITILTWKSTFFRQINVSTKEFSKEFISRKFSDVIAFYCTFPHHSVTVSHCGNFGIVLPQFLCKNSVKSTFYWRTLL